MRAIICCKCYEKKRAIHYLFLMRRMVNMMPPSSPNKKKLHASKLENITNEKQNHHCAFIWDKGFRAPIAWIMRFKKQRNWVLQKSHHSSANFAKCNYQIGRASCRERG